MRSGLGAPGTGRPARRPASTMRRRNRRVRSSLGLVKSSAGGASSMIRPSSRKHTRRAMSLAKPISCVAMTMVMPVAASSLITSSTSATSSGSSALVTSSSSMICGFIASARTIATRCCCPPESRSGKSASLSASPNLASSALASSSACAAGRRRTFAGASVTFRSTVMCGNRLNAWNTIPTCLRTRFGSTSGPVTSWPHRLIRPESIGSSRFTQRSSVDLPDPDAPIRQTTSCVATDRSMPLSTSLVPNDLCSPSILIASSPTTGIGLGCAPALMRWLRRGGGGGPARSAGR